MEVDGWEVEQLFLISALLLVLHQRCKDVMVQCLCGYQVTKRKVERERERRRDRQTPGATEITQSIFTR